MSFWSTAPVEVAKDVVPGTAGRPAMRGCAGEPLGQPVTRPLQRSLLALAPVAALALVVLLDAVARSRWDWPLPVIGILDEPAHLATAFVFLAALLPVRAAGLLPWALAGSVLIDLDHVPLYLWGLLADADGSRPVTHSVATIAVLLVLGALTRGRARGVLTGLGIGVALHLVRDLATGPGVPVAWPVDPTVILVPYWTYVLLLGAVAAVATGRLVLRAPAGSPRR